MSMRKIVFRETEELYFVAKKKSGFPTKTDFIFFINFFGLSFKSYRIIFLMKEEKKKTLEYFW